MSVASISGYIWLISDTIVCNKQHHSGVKIIDSLTYTIREKATHTSGVSDYITTLM